MTGVPRQTSTYTPDTSRSGLEPPVRALDVVPDRRVVREVGVDLPRRERRGRVGILLEELDRDRSSVLLHEHPVLGYERILLGRSHLNGHPPARKRGEACNA